jgi:hypothetical protein
MPSFRLDDHACVYFAPTAIPHESAPTGSVFRPFNDLDQAKEYADKVCAFFAEYGAPAPVFVVRGPTSTTKAKFEVVDATSTYSVVYRVQPPDYVPRHKTFADVILANDAKKSMDEQAGLHFMAITDMLNPKSSEELRDLSVERCKAFMERGIPCMSATHQGREGVDRQMLVQFLGFDWPERCIDDIEQLFRGYLRAGVMPIHEELHDMSSSGSYVAAPTALQYAVDCGKARLMVALLDEGADETLVPTKPVIGIAGGEVLAQPGDFVAYIESRLGINTSEMLAGARAALMRRHIARAGAPDAADAVAIHRRAKRAAL